MMIRSSKFLSDALREVLMRKKLLLAFCRCDPIQVVQSCLQSPQCSDGYALLAKRVYPSQKDWQVRSLDFCCKQCCFLEKHR